MLDSKSISLRYEGPLPRFSGIFAQAFSITARFYCRTFHRSLSRPVRGKYRCWKCLREFDAPW